MRDSDREVFEQFVRAHTGRAKIEKVGEGRYQSTVDPDERMCDFCMADSALYVFDAETASVVTMLDGDRAIEHQSIGGWAACPKCKLLIEAGDQNSVTTHSTSTMARYEGIPFNELLPHVRRIQRVFWKKRKAKKR